MMKATLLVIGISLVVLILGLQYLYFIPEPAATIERPTLPQPYAPGQFASEREPEALPDEDYCTDDEPCIVPLSQVISNAARYDGRRVLAFGILKVEDQGSILFADPTAYAANNRAAAVILTLSRPATAPDGWDLREQEGAAVLLEGRFVTTGPGRHAGLISDIALIRPGSFFQ